MPYATRPDLESRFGAGEIAELAEDPDDEAADRTIAALADAAAIVDSHLATAYALPLPSPAGTRYPLLVEIASNVARARLYDDASLERPQELMKMAMVRLEELRKGAVQLVDSAGRVVPRRDRPQLAMPAPAMTRDALRDY